MLFPLTIIPQLDGMKRDKMQQQKGSHHILVDDRVWGGLMMTAHSRKMRISDYLEPLLAEILHLENEGQDPLAILKRARKKKEVT